MMSLYLLIIVTAIEAQILFNCPKPTEIQSDFVRQKFNITEFASNQTYYEIAYKDMTQPRFCKCITSRKQWVEETHQIKDAFTIECAGKPYHSELVFNQTSSSDKGDFIGVWNQQGIPILSALRFPDTIVDVGVSTRSDGTLEYDWAVEFQCTEGPGGIILFYAFNFYSSTNTVEHFESMKAAFLNSGLEKFLVRGSKIQMVDHHDCWYQK
jgi:hypothetical protein